LPLGSNVAVSQTPTGNLALSLQQALSANVAALTRIDTTQMPVGTLLQGKGADHADAAARHHAAGDLPFAGDLLNNAMAGATLTVDSPQPLRVGSLLSAVVQNAQTLNFVPLSAQGSVGHYPTTLHPAKSPRLAGRSSAHCKTCPATTRHRPTCARPPTVCWPPCPTWRKSAIPKVLAQVIQNSGAFLKPNCLPGKTRKSRRWT
jgi:hypothetical protein